MLAGAIQLAVVRGNGSRRRTGRSSLSVTLLVSGVVVPHPRAEPAGSSPASAFLHHAIGWTLARRGDLPARRRRCSRGARVWAYGFAMTWIVLAVMLFCDRDVAPIFGHLSDLAGGPAVRRALAAAALVGARPAGAARRARDARRAPSPATQSRVDAPPTVVVLRFDQSVDDAARRDRGVRGGRPQGLRRRRRRRDGGRVVRAPRQRACASGRRTPSAGARRPPTVTSGTGVYTFGIGVDAAAADRGRTAPRARPGATTSPAGRSSSRSRCCSASIGIRLLVLREPIRASMSNRVYVLGTAGAVARAQRRDRGFVMRAANALQVPFVDLLYGDLSPFATKTRFGIAFVAMTLGFGVVPDDPRRCSPGCSTGPGSSGRRSCSRVALRRGYPLSGHQATEPNASVLGQVADWVHLVAAMLWVGGVLTLAVVVWPLAPDLRRAAFLGFSRIAIVLVGVLVARRAPYLAIERLPDRLRPLGRRATGRRCSSSSRSSAWRSHGAAIHHFVRAAAARARRGAGAGSAAA